MKVKTYIEPTGHPSEWECWVTTFDSIYKNQGNFYTICILKNYRGETIRLLSHYSKTEQEAGKVHLAYSTQAKHFF